MVAAAGAGVRAVEVELLRRQARLPRLLVQRRREIALIGPRSVGCTLTSMTPGSGVTMSWVSRGSGGGP